MVIDIIVVAIAILGAFIGYKKGMSGILIKVIGLILAIVLAFVLQMPIAKMLYNSGIGNSLNGMIKDGINETLQKGKFDSETNKGDTFYSYLIKGVATDEQIETVSSNITMTLLKAISFIATFLIVRIIIYIIANLLNVVVKIPLIGIVNSLLGMALGLISYITILFIILMALYLVAPITDKIDNIINQTTITKILYNNNIFM